MAGTIFFPGDLTWSASSSAFSWVLTSLAARVSDQELAEHLRRLVDANVGMLDVEDLSEEQFTEIVALLQTLPDVAREALSDLEARDSYVERVEQLALVAGTSSKIPPSE